MQGVFKRIKCCCKVVILETYFIKLFNIHVTNQIIMSEKFKNHETSDQPADPEKRNTMIKLGIGALVAAIGASVANCEKGKAPGPEGCEGCVASHSHRRVNSGAFTEGSAHGYRRRYRRYPTNRRQQRWNARLEKPEGCGIMWCEGPEGY
jgi:hypothetical protein